MYRIDRNDANAPCAHAVAFLCRCIRPKPFAGRFRLRFATLACNLIESQLALSESMQHTSSVSSFMFHVFVCAVCCARWEMTLPAMHRRRLSDFCAYPESYAFEWEQTSDTGPSANIYRSLKCTRTERNRLVPSSWSSFVRSLSRCWTTWNSNFNAYLARSFAPTVTRIVAYNIPSMTISGRQCAHIVCDK